MATAFSGGPPKKPHLLLMLADDLGYANVGWHNADIQTPSLDALVAEGVRLERHYVYQFCSPSRASLMTGRNPIHVQERMGPYWTTYTGPPLNMTILPKKLSDAGYIGHQVGKWHLGAYSAAALPVGRGFASSFGFLDGMEDHWNHRMLGCNVSGMEDGSIPDLPGTQWGCWGNALPLETCDELSCCANLSARFDHDLWRDHVPADHAAHEGVFSQDMYEAEIVKIIGAHPLDVPLFMYMAFQLVHSPIQTPKRFIDLYDKERFPFLGLRKAWGFVSALDESIGRIIKALKAREGMWDSSLLVFSSDNGGPLETMTNYPLRGTPLSSSIRPPADRLLSPIYSSHPPPHLCPGTGGKFSDWEGGVRSAAFASGGLLPEAVRGSTSHGYAMLADWWVTFTKLAGLDAVDHMAANAGLPPVDGFDLWPMLSGRNLTSPRTELPISSNTLTVGDWKIITGTQRYNTWSPSTGWPADWQCIDRNASKPGNCTSGCLFNVHDDPNEHHDLAQTNPSMLARMLARLADVQATVWHNCDPPTVCVPDEAGKDCANAHSQWGDVYGPFLPS